MKFRKILVHGVYRKFSPYCDAIRWYGCRWVARNGESKHICPNYGGANVFIMPVVCIHTTVLKAMGQVTSYACSGSLFSVFNQLLPWPPGRHTSPIMASSSKLASSPKIGSWMFTNTNTDTNTNTSTSTSTSDNTNTNTSTNTNTNTNTSTNTNIQLRGS